MLVACCACLCATSTTCLETQSKPNFSRNHLLKELYRKASNTEAATRFINQHCTLCQTWNEPENPYLVSWVMLYHSSPERFLYKGKFNSDNLLQNCVATQFSIIVCDFSFLFLGFAHCAHCCILCRCVVFLFKAKKVNNMRTMSRHRWRENCNLFYLIFFYLCTTVV